MKLISCFAAGLVCVHLAIGSRASAFDEPTTPSAGTAAAAPTKDALVDETIQTEDGQIKVTLPPGTKSVLKRPSADEAVTVRAGYDAGLVPVEPGNRVVDPNVRQAGGSGAGNTAASSLVAPASANKTAEEEAAQAAATAAAELMSQGLTAPKTSALSGRPTTLLELMGRVGNDRNRQIWIVRDYWKLSAAQADYNWAAEEMARLDQITATKGLESTVLAAAQAAAQARLREAQVGAISAQQELADLVAITDKNQVPLAVDPPLVGPYRTYFDTLYANRAPPPRTRAIDRGLPIRLDAIQSRYVAVQAAASAIRYAEDSRGKGQIDLQTLLACHSDWARQRRAFLASVRDYNLDIGEYALAVADPNIANDRLVAMLILVKPPVALTAAGKAEPTLATPSNADDPLFQPALPIRNPETAKKNDVRRTGGSDK